MVSHLVLYPLLLFALIWLFVILYLTWPKRSVTAPAAPAALQPLQSKRHRSNEPKAFEGWTHKPHCALCERDTAQPYPTSPVPPAPMPRRTAGPERSTPPGIFVRTAIVTIAAGWGLVISAPMGIPVGASGASFSALAVWATF
jgi:hypothetical protein